MVDDEAGGSLPGRILGLRWAALRYIVVGATLNLSSIVIFASLWAATPSAEPVLLNMATSSLLFPIWYALNRKWVFRSVGPLGPEVRRAIGTYVATMVLSATSIWVLTTFWSLPPILAQILTVGLLVVAGFLVNGLWTFTHRASLKSDGFG